MTLVIGKCYSRGGKSESYTCVDVDDPIVTSPPTSGGGVALGSGFAMFVAGMITIMNF